MSVSPAPSSTTTTTTETKKTKKHFFSIFEKSEKLEEESSKSQISCKKEISAIEKINKERVVVAATEIQPQDVEEASDFSLVIK